MVTIMLQWAHTAVNPSSLRQGSLVCRAIWPPSRRTRRLHPQTFIFNMIKNNLISLQGAPLLANLVLHPWSVTGLVDAEGSFIIRIRKNSKYKTGWLVAPVFSIAFHEQDLPLLEAIQSYFGGVGSISPGGYTPRGNKSF